jgi:hypothetical protein
MRVIRLLGGTLLVIAVSMSGNAQASALHQSNLSLSGTVHGTEMVLATIPDPGGHYDLHAHGRTAPLGRSTAAGQEHSVGFIIRGHGGADLTLTGSSGSIDVHITYAETPGFAPLPDSGTFQIVGGTGAYSDASGSGTVTRRGGPCGTFAMGCSSDVTLTFHAQRAHKHQRS